MIGTLIHELLHLPVYHYHAYTKMAAKVKYKKHYFGNHRRQYVLHFNPVPGSPSQKQVVVFFHGGGWSLGTPEMFKINAAFFASRGYHVFMPSYRRIPFYGYKEIRKDLDLGILLVKKIMAENGVGEQRIILGGMSAGGNLVGLLAYDRVSLSRINMSQSDFAGILLMGAPLDLRRMKNSPVVWAYAGSRNNPEFDLASPLHYLETEETLPILCIHGTKDGLVSFGAARHFIDKLRTKQKGKLKFHIIENGTHLDAGSWNFFDNELRREILEWLEGL